MNIVTGPYNTFPSIGYAISASQNGRMSLPVSQSSYIYAQFRHVSGTPAPEGVQGVNINRLKIIDALIERLSQIKSQGDIMSVNAADGEENINALIESVQNQIRTIQDARANSPYALAPPQTGVLFDSFA